MKKKRKKVTNRKKFFIIAGCYAAVFIITCITTAATLAWFNGSTYATNTIYMGGPVYLYFGDSDDNETSKTNNLYLETPPGWDYLYPGMNLNLKARAVIQGAKFENVNEQGDQTIVYATGAILRARVHIEVLPPEYSTVGEEEENRITQDIYRNIWSQVKAKAVKNVDGRNDGVWVIDDDYNYTTENLEEDHFFYYVLPGQNFADSGKYTLLEVGGSDENASVGFLDNAVITLSGKQLTNDHADCRITFTIVFHALQAFLPFMQNEIGQDYPGDTSNRAPVILPSDVGTPKPLTIENSRFFFNDAFDDIYEGNGIY